MFFFVCGAAGCYTGPRHRRSQQSSPPRPSFPCAAAIWRSLGFGLWRCHTVAGRRGCPVILFGLLRWANYILLDGFFMGKGVMIVFHTFSRKGYS